MASAARSPSGAAARRRGQDRALRRGPEERSLALPSAVASRGGGGSGSVSGGVAPRLPGAVQRAAAAKGRGALRASKSLEEVVLLRRWDSSKERTQLEFLAERLTDHALHAPGPRVNATERVRLERSPVIPGVPELPRLEDGSPRKRTSATVKKLKSQLADVLSRLQALEAGSNSSSGVVVGGGVGSIGSSNNNTCNDDDDDGNNCNSSSDYNEHTSSTQGQPNELVRYSSGRCSPARASRRPSEHNAGHEELVMKMDGIQETIDRLEQALNSTEGEEKLKESLRASASTMLCAAARMFVQRRRYQHAQAALRSWRERSGASVLVDRCQVMLRRHRIIDEQREDFFLRCRERSKKALLREWRAETVAGRARREVLCGKADAMRDRLARDSLRQILHRWYEEAFGPHSRKQVAAAYQARLLKMREQLVEENAKRPAAHQHQVTREVVGDALSEEAERLIMARRAWHTKRVCFKTWTEDYMFNLTQLKKRAEHHWRARRFPRFLRVWRLFVARVQAEASVLNTFDRGRFDDAHNERVVANFYRTALLRRTFREWRNQAAQDKMVRSKYAGILQGRLRSVFAAWRAQALHHKQVKQLCLREWLDVGHRRRELPFRAWCIYTKTAIRQREGQNVLLAAFARRKRRLRMTYVFKTWSHNAIYGKTGGMHSRAALIKALETQKQMVAVAELSLAQQRGTIADIETALNTEKERSQALQVQLSGLEGAAIKQRFAQQQLEAEIVRLQGLFDSMALIHPGTAKRLVAADAAVGISGKGIGSVARRMAQKQRMAGSGDGGGLLGAGTGAANAAPAPCQRCGNNCDFYDDVAVRPRSAREMLTRSDLLPDDAPLELPSKLASDSVAWVTKRDSQVLLRAAWAVKKVKLFAKRQDVQSKRKLAQPGGALAAGPQQSAAELADAAALEARNLRAVLAFVFCGDPSATALFEPDDAGEHASTSDHDHVTDGKRAVDLIERAALHTAANWNDFLQGITKQFPLLHPANDDASEALARRISAAKHNSQQKKLRVFDKNRLNVYAAGGVS